MDYKSKRWLALRARVLRRDKGLCREAMRYGRRVEATTVHHVYPVEDYPELQWAEWNLISVSQQAHNSFHDRSTGKLTPAGLAWQRRIAPPRKTKTEGASVTGLGDSFRRTENNGRGVSDKKIREQDARANDAGARVPGHPVSPGAGLFSPPPPGTHGESSTSLGAAFRPRLGKPDDGIRGDQQWPERT